MLDRDQSHSVGLTDLYEFPGAYAQRFDGIDPALEDPLRAFLNTVSRKLRLDTLTEETSANVAVERVDLEGDPTEPLFTLDGLCSLTKLYVTDDRVAKRLCARLKLAEAADTCGKQLLKEKLLAEYIFSLEKEVHLTLTRKNETTLIWLTIGYFEVTDDTTKPE
jgi:hypothetical protein